MMNITIMITGGTDGIGRATALELASRGASVQNLGTNPERAETTLAKLRDINPQGEDKFFGEDISTVAAPKKLLDWIQSAHDNLDVLILSAGVFPPKGTLSEDGIDLAFAVGYMSR